MEDRPPSDATAPAPEGDGAGTAPLREAIDRVNILSTLMDELGRGVELDELGPHAAQTALQLTGTDLGAVALADPDTHQLHYQWWAGFPADAPMEQLQREFDLKHGVAGKVATSAEAHVVEDYRTFPGALPAYLGLGVRSVLSAPIAVEGEPPMGVLSVASVDRAHTFTPEHSHIIQTLARHLGLAFQRQRLLDRLRTSESRFRTVVETVPDMLYTATLPNFRTTFVSAGIEEVLGFDGNAWLEEPDLWTRQIHNADRERVLKEVSHDVTERGRFRCEYRMWHRDGRTVVWIEDRGTAMPANGSDPASVVGIMTNITERKRMEDELRQSEQRYRVVFDTSPVAWGMTDADGRVLAANRAVRELTGYSSSELRAVPMHTHYAVPAQRDAVLAELSSQGRVRDHEIELKRKDGSIRDVLVNADRIELDGEQLLLISLRDVTSRKQAEAALEENEHKFRTIASAARDGIILSDADGVTTYFNEAAARMFGYSPEEMDGRNALELMALPSHRALGRRALRGFGTTGTAPLVGRTTELEAVRKDGATFPVELSMSSVKLNGSWHAVGIVRDITERQQAEAERTEHAQRLHRSLEQTIAAVAMTVEKRDPYTSGHQQRTTQLAVAIAREMKLEPDRIDGIRVATTIHDIGKIYIPAEILNRPGRLSSAEFDMIKTHPEVGFDIVRNVEFPWPVAQTILQHHERLDGSGYPQGLKGEAIIQEARILAVADVVEAITAHRPYRAALGVDYALQEIESHRGTLYDPSAVDACLRLFRDQRFSF